MTAIVLFVDDDQNVLDGLKRTYRNEPYEIMTAANAKAALDIMRGIRVDVVVTDFKMPGISGTQLLSLIRQEFPDVLRLMLTGEGNLETAVQAINCGEVYRFFTKPYNEIELGIAIRQALEYHSIVAANKKMLEVLRMQSAYIERLEQDYPGISQVERDQSGAVIVKPVETDLTTLLEELEGELKKQQLTWGTLS